MEFKVRIETCIDNPEYSYVKDTSEGSSMWKGASRVHEDDVSEHIAGLLDAWLAKQKRQLRVAIEEDLALDQMYCGGKA